MYISGNLEDISDIRFWVGKSGVSLRHFNDPLFLKNFCWKGGIGGRNQKSFDRYSGYMKRAYQVKGIGIVLLFDNLTAKSKDVKEELFNWVLQNLTQQTVGLIDHKLYEDRILLKQKVNKSNRNQNLWDAFLKFGKDNREPLAGTLKFLTHFKEAYMLVDKRKDDYDSWDPFNGIYDRNRGFEPDFDYSDVACAIRDLDHLLTVDMYEALGIRNYFAQFFKSELSRQVVEDFWDSFIQFAIAWCYDHDQDDMDFSEDVFSDLFEPDDFENFRQNILIKASQSPIFNTLNNLRQYIIWNEVQHQKQKRIEKATQKQIQKPAPIIHEEEDIPF